MTYRINDPHATKLMIKYAYTTFTPGKDWSLARYDSQDCLLGGVIINWYTGIMGSAELHVCSFRPRWNSRSLLYYTFHYPFEVLKVRKLISPVPEYNWQSYRFATHIGFKEEVLITDIYPWEPSGMYVLSMYKEECMWLKMKPPRLSIVELMNTVGVENA